MSDLDKLLAQYDYPISPQQIAQKPRTPRDSARLLIYDRKTNTTEFDSYKNLAKHIPLNALLVFNDTKVIPARIPGRLSTGGKVELLCTKFEPKRLWALCERSLANGQSIWLSKSHVLTVVEKVGKEYQLELPEKFDIRGFMKRHGVTPLPPYLKLSPLSEKERRTRYQSVFAQHEGSIAAPTASLHFTPRVFRSLEKAGVETAFVTLHVNLGTFLPLTDQNITEGKLHEEYFEISKSAAKKIREAKRHGRPVIPVGTTALRTLESCAQPLLSERLTRSLSGTTRLFIQEGYAFRIADGLITNFHVPRSSLMMLVAALVGRKRILDLYALARQRDFTFFSFGDGMLIR
ncbi:MAG: hypothetical protein RIQ56_433 [Candidatus Parcubacteria bacterium]|jgi:S-adenosylmethionine:tRNA ribosyltransferase-isomerase